MKNTRSIAIDIGGSSGRVMLIDLVDGHLSLKEIHRFANRIDELSDGHHWNIEYLLEGIKEGLEKLDYEEGDSISVDTWGVDYVLLDNEGKRVSEPFCYRDTRTSGGIEKLEKTISLDEIYSRTGIQTMEINTLFQLMAEKNVGKVVFIPDYILYELSGVENTELSIASTSQLVNPEKRDWSENTIKELGLDKFTFLPIRKSGSVLGKYRNNEKATVISGCGHDTQAAVVAVPATEKDFLFISSGTWSLIGTELDKPVLTKESSTLNLTNEIGYDGRISYMKNIIGLWILQCLKAEWNISFGEMEDLAKAATPFKAALDPDDPLFTPPGNMEERIRKYMKDTNQDENLTRGEIVRTVNESLAMKYRYATEQIETSTGKKFNAIHIIGGGSQSLLLSQFTSNALKIPAILGPVEATAIGNGLVQFLAKGEIKSLEEAREIVSRMPEIKRLKPVDPAVWDSAYQNYVNKILNR